MARYPNAVWKPIKANFTRGANHPNTIVYHTASDGRNTTSLQGWFNRPSTKASAHFFVDGSGRIEQYIDTADSAWSAFSANSHSISIETHDGGNPANPWNNAQLFALTVLTDWIIKNHHIPRQLCTSPNSGGLGWHEMFSDWNHNGHRCPGPVREAQVRNVILPHIVNVPAPVPPPVPGPTPPPISPSAGNALEELARNLAYCKLFVIGDGHNTSPMAVTFVQWGINAAKTSGVLVPDGKWGPATKAAVLHFQQSHHLVADGLVGPSTWALLYP